MSEKPDVLRLRPSERPIRDEWRALSPELRDAIKRGYAPDPWTSSKPQEPSNDT